MTNNPGDKMINVAYLAKIIGADKISTLVAEIDAPPLDVDLALEEARQSGEINLDKENDTLEIVKYEPSCDESLKEKILKTIHNYAQHEANITRGRLNTLIKDPMSGLGYAWHDYITTLQYLIDNGDIEELEVSVPKAGKRPYHKFVFLGLPENPNEEWNARDINNWIDNWKPDKVK